LNQPIHVILAITRWFLASLFAATLSAMPAIAAETAAPLAELVAMRTTDGLLLHGLHYRPDRPSTTVVIHVPGGPGAFYSIQDMAPVASELTANGYHFLSVTSSTWRRQCSWPCSEG
jgi:dipeptidyl aminopeptidase/acylaminoacyl peptidase